MELRTGDTLPNGATVVVASITHEGDGGEAVVLARFHGPQPWVTWTFVPDDPRTTGAGHYFDRLADAVADYEARGGRA